MPQKGKVILARKLKSLKITLDEKSLIELVIYFKVKTSLDLFYRVGAGTIDNTKLKDFASSRSNALMTFFKKQNSRKPSVKPEDVDKEEITDKFDPWCLAKKKKN